jgi:hypothetical protein
MMVCVVREERVHVRESFQHGLVTRLLIILGTTQSLLRLVPSTVHSTHHERERFDNPRAPIFFMGTSNIMLYDDLISRASVAFSPVILRRILRRKPLGSIPITSNWL